MFKGIAAVAEQIQDIRQSGSDLENRRVDRFIRRRAGDALLAFVALLLLAVLLDTIHGPGGADDPLSALVFLVAATLLMLGVPAEIARYAVPLNRSPLTAARLVHIQHHGPFGRVLVFDRLDETGGMFALRALPDVFGSAIPIGAVQVFALPEGRAPLMISSADDILSDARRVEIAQMIQEYVLEESASAETVWQKAPAHLTQA